MDTLEAIREVEDIVDRLRRVRDGGSPNWKSKVRRGCDAMEELLKDLKVAAFEETRKAN